MKRAFLALISAAALIPAAAAASTPKLSQDLQNADPGSNLLVIVQWNTAPGEAQNQKITNLGGVVHYGFKSIKGGVYTVPASALQVLANDSDVAYIAPDRTINGKLDNSAAAVNAQSAWTAGWTGNGIAVALIDSGVDNDPNLGSILYTYDFTSGGAASSASALLAKMPAPLPAGSKPPGGGGAAPDNYGHGQHVAGIIASNGSSSTCTNCTRLFKGIAPGVHLVDLRVLNGTGQGTDSNVILAIDMAIYLKNVFNIRVINLSLGRPVYESYTQDPLCQAVEAAWKAGIVVVVAAGNDGRDDTYGEQGYGTINAPGNDPYVITVGAMKTEGTYTRTDDLVASYSSKGPTPVDHIVKPDIMAPGNLVVSLLASGATLKNQYPTNQVQMSYFESNPNNGQATQDSNNYFVLSGTSMATPVVTGAVADLLQANPKLTPDQVKMLLMQTAYKNLPASSSVTDSTGTYTDYDDIFTVGAGYLDIAAALASINSVPSGVNALSPTANYNPNSGTVSLSYDPSSIWANPLLSGTKCLWGANSIWSAAVLNGNQCIWSSKSIWGASSIGSTKCLWGANSIWAASEPEATTIFITGEP